VRDKDRALNFLPVKIHICQKKEQS